MATKMVVKVQQPTPKVQIYEEMNEEGRAEIDELMARLQVESTARVEKLIRDGLIKPHPPVKK